MDNYHAKHEVDYDVMNDQVSVLILTRADNVFKNSCTFVALLSAPLVQSSYLFDVVQYICASWQKSYRKISKIFVML